MQESYHLAPDGNSSKEEMSAHKKLVTEMKGFMMEDPIKWNKIKNNRGQWRDTDVMPCTPFTARGMLFLAGRRDSVRKFGIFN